MTAPYPPGASGAARVVLELVVDRAGQVKSVAVTEGPEPFASAALAAAKGFTFDPALKNGVAVAARVLAEVRFEPPAPPEPEPAETPPPTTPSSPGAKPGAKPSASPPPPKPVEVSVQGTKSPPGSTSLGRAEVRMLPGAFGDPFRAVEILPGVTPIASGVPFFFVRGAPPGNVGYFLDGIQVPLLFHIGAGPSVIHPALMGEVELHPAAYPAQFGRFTGGIVAGQTKGFASEPHGEALLRAVDAGALVEVPFADGKASALAGGRYSYTAPLLSLVAPDTVLEYWDWQARLSVKPTPRDRLTVLGFGAYDYLGNKITIPGEPEPVTDPLFQTQFHRVDLRWDHSLGAKGSVRTAMTFGYDRTGFGSESFSPTEGGPAVRVQRYTEAFTLGVRSLLRYRVTDAVSLKAGLDTQFQRFDVRLGDFAADAFADLFPSRDDLAASAFAEVQARIDPGLEATFALRGDAYSSLGASAGSLDPRLSMRVFVTDRVRLFSSMGLASQPPGFVAPGPGFAPGGLRGGLQRAAQVSLGVEASLPEEIEARAVLFHNAFFDLSDALGSTSRTSLTAPQNLSDRWLGRSSGLELWLQRKLTKRVGALVSYTLSASERVGGRQRFASQFDRTHSLNAAVQVDLGAGVAWGARHVVYSGTPTSTRPLPEGVPQRLPWFHRWDWRLEKRFSVLRTGWVSLIAEIQNSFFADETIAIVCSGDSGPGIGQLGAAACKPQNIGPVAIPSIGVEGGF